MKHAFIDCFAEQLAESDILLMPEPIYFGARSSARSPAMTSFGASPRAADEHTRCPTGMLAGKMLLELARHGDKIVVMGARDDTLSEFAGRLVDEIGARGG